MTRYDDIGKAALDAGDLDESLEILEYLLSGGFSVWTDGETLYNIKQLVAQVKGLKIEVYAKEHPPPHFHINGGGINATFSVVDGEHLEGKIGGREKALVEWWYKRSRHR